VQFVATLFLEMIRELHDQNAVATRGRKGDQSDPTVDVDRWQTWEREEKQTGKRERPSQPARMMNGSRKLSNRAASTR